jgi:dTDP-4-dehydrorhamnose reductase
MVEGNRRVLITGTTGLVGYHIYNLLKPVKGLTIAGTSRSSGKNVDCQADLTNPDSVLELARIAPADIVIHAAAISKTDVCQAEQEKCYKANVESTKNLLAAYPSAKFFYFSTYAVYNTTEGRCTESAPVSATNYYIETKLLGEDLVVSRPGSIILRPSVVFGFLHHERESKNYFMQLVENIRMKKVTRSPVDQYFNPVHVDVVAEVVKRAIENDISGIYNIGSNEDTSKFGFNQQIMKRFGFDDQYLEGIDSQTLAVTRPNNGTVSSRRIQDILGYKFPPLADMIEQLYESTRGYTLTE